MAALAVVPFSAVGIPAAMAAPSPVPDLSGYHSVEPKDYTTYYNYPTTNGAQFLTPGGYRCRITYTGRANPPFKTAECWGALPATAFNLVVVATSMSANPAQFDNIDLAKMETYNGWEDPTKPLPISPDAYKPLPAGSKLTYPDSGTCAATATTTTCVLGDHGFVLDPSGSRTF
ncbi:hypothetical protein [Mycobacterium branderi]|uniref:hypothetical protein n=1 Tax=Mycobacterium branderi TaxID=43348 RepID=UPI00111C6947|nr:hypothetical protein [Mycobacterium branderi]MCV7235240.1 hypothetical protein [Mycobacterium branderi]